MQTLVVFLSGAIVGFFAIFCAAMVGWNVREGNTNDGRIWIVFTLIAWPISILLLFYARGH